MSCLTSRSCRHKIDDEFCYLKILSGNFIQLLLLKQAGNYGESTRIEYTMDSARAAWCQGYTPEHVFVSYFLKHYSYIHGDSRSFHRISFSLGLYVADLISSCQLQMICSYFSLETDTLVAILVAFFENRPVPSRNWGFGNWTPDETLALLATHVSKPSMYRLFMPRLRSENSKRMRMIRVIEQLEGEGRLRHQDCLPMPQNRSSVEVQVDMRTESERSLSQVGELRHSLRRTKANFMRKERRYVKKINCFRARIAVLQRKLGALEKQLAQQDQMEEEDSDEVNDSPEARNLMEKLLRETCMNLQVHQNRRQYSQETFEIAQLIKLTSPKAYRVIRQLFPLPSPSVLWNHFSGEISLTKTLLLGNDGALFERIDQLCENCEEGTASTLGVDAFAFRTFTGASTLHASVSPTEYSSAFLFVNIPLDPKYPPRVIHILPKRTGSYDDQVAERVREIQNQFRMRKRQVWFKSTDGDPYLSKEHEIFFKRFVESNVSDFSLLVSEIYQSLISGTTMPVADPLHFGKNVRGKLLDHDVAVLATEKEFLSTNASTLESILRLGDTLQDKSQVGRMRDVYVTKLFSLKNVCILLEKKQYHAAILFLPYACVYTVLYAENPLPTSRVFLAKLAYVAYYRLLIEAETLTKTFKTVKFRYQRKAQAVTFAEPVYVKRMMHTCIALGITLDYGPRNVRLDSVGTHLVENAIGLARTLSNSSDFHNIVAAFANSEMRKSVAMRHGVRLHVPRRVNDGGVKVDTFDECDVSIPNGWDAHDILEMLFEKAKAISEESSEFDVFFDQLKSVTNELTMRLPTNATDVTNSLIMERNRRFHAFCATQSQEI